MIEKAINLLFPQRCEICNTLGKYICSNCYKQLTKYELQNNSNEKYFLYKYEELIRKMIINYKFNGKGYLYNLFSECILNNEKACEFIKQYDVLVPVPLHKKRRNERGYNQSELIAEKITKELQKKETFNKIILNEKLLKKIKNTKPQSKQNLKGRVKSVKGVYIVNKPIEIRGKKVLLFDDIYTTGSTYRECKKVLLNAGATEVGIFTIAKDFMK